MIALGSLILAPPASAAEINWFLFPSLDLAYGDGFDSELFEDEAVPALDIFFSSQGRHLRVLGEAVISTTEQEVERLQLGLGAPERKILWIGRFHTPLSAWNQAYHHGEYLQTSISRPAVIDFEDDSGPLPSHLSGLLLDGTFGKEPETWEFSLGIGAGPILEQGFEPFDLLAPNDVGELSAIGRLSYDRSDPENLSLGGFLGAFDIEARGHAFSEIRQRLAGLDLLIDHELSRWLAALIFTRNEFVGTGFGDEDFLSGYLQAERSFSERWKGYARAEATDAKLGDVYFALLPDFERSRLAAGTRLDFSTDQALKFELTRSEGLDGEWFTTVRFQWSAVIAR